MCIVKLAVGYIVFEQKQIVILADEKSAAEWRRLDADSCIGRFNRNGVWQ